METEIVKDNLPLIIWTAVIAVVFLFLWRKGHLLRFRNYILETREELRRCSWPTLAELKGSTVVVMVAVLLLGVYTVVVDNIFATLILWLTMA